MSRVAERSALTAAEYLAWERQQPVKHEFFDGEVFAMAGGSPRHAQLCGNALIELGIALRPRGCRIVPSDQQLAFPPRDRYVYPDVTVICGPSEFQLDARDVLVNPTILVEVLSKSTAEYDRGLKWAGYQHIPSLTDYLLVAQAEVRIEHFQRSANGSWAYREARRGEEIVLTGGVSIAVDAIYVGAFDLPGD